MDRKPVKFPPFTLTSHFFDRVCAGHDHVLDMPLPDGETVVGLNTSRYATSKTFPNSMGAIIRESWGVEFCPWNPFDQHEMYPWSSISWIDDRPPSYSWYLSYADWYADTHGMSIQEAAEMSMRASNVESDKYFSDMFRRFGLGPDDPDGMGF